QQMMATAERFAHAAEALDRVLDRLDAQQEALNAKVDRIVAAVQEHLDEAEGTAVLDKQDTVRLLQERLAELEKSQRGAQGSHCAHGSEDAATSGFGVTGEG